MLTCEYALFAILFLEKKGGVLAKKNVVCWSNGSAVLNLGVMHHWTDTISMLYYAYGKKTR